ncbi:MAG: DUF5118 domain-containing protein [Butyricimonas faecalis]
MKYLLIVLLSLYVFSSGAGSRVILNEEGKEYRSLNLFGRYPEGFGFFNVYVQDGRYYLEIPDDKLQRIFSGSNNSQGCCPKNEVGLPVSGMVVIRCLIG